MKSLKELVWFDWAMKKLLRDNTNLSELLADDLVIKEILDSESNPSTKSEKHILIDKVCFFIFCNF